MPPEDLEVVTKSWLLGEFMEQLSKQFPLREACILRHERIDDRLKKGDDNFEAVSKEFGAMNDRLGKIERRIYAALVVFVVLEALLRTGIIHLPWT